MENFPRFHMSLVCSSVNSMSSACSSELRYTKYTHAARQITESIAPKIRMEFLKFANGIMIGTRPISALVPKTAIR